ncbi:zinc ion binding [Branchiostoma belcheri]|nr:zinc ion binding [Branchiostoma belcheri]
MSTSSPVNQQDIQQHLNSTIPEERKDTSPGDVKESLQDALSGASAEHSVQDHLPGHSTDDGTERPSLPTEGPSDKNIGKTDQNQAFYSETPSSPETCTSDTHVDDVKQHQVLRADNSLEKAEQQSSNDMYDAKGYNENNEGQYQLRDTCVKEVSVTAYQCSEDVDEASIGIDCSKKGAGGLDQPVAKQLEDAENSYQNEFELEEDVTADDSCIRPYAVAHQPDSKTNDEEDDTFDVQPYAVAYDEQDINYDEQQPTGESADYSHSEWGGPNTSLESVAGKTDGLLRNPMYIGNVLHQNPMYAPNTAQPRADGGHSCLLSQSCLVGGIIKGLIVATLAVITALIISIYVPAKQGSYMQTTTWMNTSFEVKTPTNVIQYTNYTSPPQPDIKENENKDLQQKTIVFRLNCEEFSDCSGVEAVAVSPGNEIFVADTYNRQVQVFSMKGVSLRHFPTVTSGENSETMEPDDISIDGQGHVWVVGNADRMSGFIVRYTKLGSLLITLRATFSNNSYSGMTVDTLRNLVVATEHWWGYGEVKLLHFNGTVEHKFRVQQGSGYPGVVAVGREGNLFVSDSIGDARVHVYNNRSQYLYSFGGHDIDEGQAEIGLGSTKIGMGLAGIGEGRTVIDLGKTEIGEGITETDENEADEVTGICTDGSGNVLLVRSGGAVDMFTEDGRYVRRVVPSRAGGVAVAPGGQLVVTNFDTILCIIFDGRRGLGLLETLSVTTKQENHAKAGEYAAMLQQHDRDAGQLLVQDRGDEGNMEREKGMTKPDREAAEAAGQEREEIIAVKETEALRRVLVSAEERGKGRVGREVRHRKPGRREGAAEQPSSSTTGNTFRRYLQKLGIDERDTAWVQVRMCYLPSHGRSIGQRGDGPRRVVHGKDGIPLHENHTGYGTRRPRSAYSFTGSQTVMGVPACH